MTVSTVVGVLYEAATVGNSTTISRHERICCLSNDFCIAHTHSTLIQSDKFSSYNNNKKWPDNIAIHSYSDNPRQNWSTDRSAHAQNAQNALSVCAQRQIFQVCFRWFDCSRACSITMNISMFIIIRAVSKMSYTSVNCCAAWQLTCIIFVVFLRYANISSTFFYENVEEGEGCELFCRFAMSSAEWIRNENDTNPMATEKLWQMHNVNANICIDSAFQSSLNMIWIQ